MAACPRCGATGPFGRQRSEWEQKRELYDAPGGKSPDGRRGLKWLGFAILGSVGALYLMEAVGGLTL